MAVEMAKLSLWLVTLPKDRAFTFVDHALRCGDSLIGITELNQLDCFHINIATGRSLHEGTLFDPGTHIEPLVKGALELRRQLESFTVAEVRDAERKHQLLESSNDLLNELKVIGDLVVGGAFSAATQSLEAYDGRLLSVADDVVLALDPDRKPEDRAARIYDLGLKALYWLDEGRPPLAPPTKCLHWPLEFPEVFRRDTRPGFDAIIGNPPFLGNKYWKEKLGANLQGFARMLLGQAPGKIDLAVLFLRRAFDLLTQGGVWGLLTPTQAAEGEALAVGLGELSNRGTIYRAKRSVPWPGEAKVRINQVWFRRGAYVGARSLDGRLVGEIGPQLVPGRNRSEPVPIPVPDLWAFVGADNSRGEGFLLRPGDKWFDLLRDKEPQLVRPYISGEDLGARPIETITRWAVCTEDLAIDEVESRFPLTARFLHEIVEPQRSSGVLKPYKGLRARWWQFWNHRADLFRHLRQRETCVAMPKVAMHVMCVPVPTSWVFTNQVVVIALPVRELFAVLSSSIFNLWTMEFSTSYGAGKGIRPSLSRGIKTFPSPVLGDAPVLSTLAETWEKHIVGWQSAHELGFTAFVNSLSTPSAEMGDARECLTTIDRAVVDAYGWTDLDLDHAFHETDQGVRFTVGPEARTQILDRLLELNYERGSRGDAELAAASQPLATRGTRRSRSKQTDTLWSSES